MPEVSGAFAGGRRRQLPPPEKNSTWLWNTARGISGEEVEGRLLPKRHGCGMTFPGPQALRAIDSVEHWLNQLCEELSERIQSDLEKNKRIARTLTLHARASKVNDLEPHRKFPSKSCPLRYGTMKIQEDAKRLFESGLREFLDSQNTGWAITSLSVGASKILETPHGTSSILRFFPSSDSTCSSSQLEPTRFVQDKAPELSGRDQVPKSGQTETRSCKFEEDRKGDSGSVSQEGIDQYQELFFI